MKKKSWAIGLTAAVAAMSVGVAAPARAQVQDCAGGVPPLASTGTVTLADGQIRINPNAPVQDVENLPTYVNDLAAALETCAVGLVPLQVWCLFQEFVREPVYDLRFGKWVYTDPDTGEIVVDYGQVQDDLVGCL